MADASYLQASFLGGEWSPLVQGRMDDPRYRTGMNVCRNTIPIEEGSAVRRSGIRVLAATRGGAPAVLRQFHFTQSHPYNIELTAGHLRLFAGTGLVVENTSKNIHIVGGNPTILDLLTPHGWSVGDQVIAQPDAAQNLANTPNVTLAQLFGRELRITSTTTDTITVVDALTGANIDSTGASIGSSIVPVSRILDFATDYQLADLQDINAVQGQTHDLGNFATLLHGNYPPAALLSGLNPVTGEFAEFTWNPAIPFTDGPYFDPPNVSGAPDGSVITPSGVSGSVTLTLTQGTTTPAFVTTDVGRSVRLFSEPATWASGSAYSIGDQVKFDGGYYQALTANTGVEPDVSVTDWGVSTSAAVWMWATITAFTDATHVTAMLKPVIANGTIGPNLPRTTACTFRLGVYSDTTSYPTAGVYSEGRLWLVGAQPNRFDASVSNSSFDFTPTAPDGTVADNNAIAGIFNASTAERIIWIIPDALGMIAGTPGGEWLISSTREDDPITPTSIKAKQRTNYGSDTIQAQRAGLTILFVQRYGKKLQEYVTSDYRGLTARDLTLTGKHLTAKDGIAEIAYMQEKTPVVWARTRSGDLISCTYSRSSAYASDPPDFSGWARHDLGYIAGRTLTVTSIQSGPNYDGTLDALTLVLTDGAQNYVGLLTDQFDTEWQLGDSNYVDFSVPPKMWQKVGDVISLYSLHRLAGQTVDVFFAGIDYGSLPVSAGGQLDVPINGLSGPALLATTTYLQSLVSDTNFHSLGMKFQVSGAGGDFPEYSGFYAINDQLYPVIVDWDDHAAFVFPTGAGTDFTKVEVLDGTVIDTGSIDNAYTGSPIQSLAQDDTYVYGASAIFNVGLGMFTEVCAYSKADLTKVQTLQWNVSLSDYFSGPGFAFGIGGMVPVVSGGSTFIVQAPVDTFTTLGVFDLAGSGLVNLDLPTGYVCGHVCNSSVAANAYCVAPVGVWGSFPTGETLGVFNVEVASDGSASITQLGDIDPADISPGWTAAKLPINNPIITYAGVNSIFLDSSDGNVVANALRVSGTGPTQMLFKFDPTTQAVLWSIEIDINGQNNFTHNRVENGKLVFFDGDSIATWTMKMLDLATGVVASSEALDGYFPGPALYDDVTGASVVVASWGGGSPPDPAPIPPTGDTGGAVTVLVPPSYPGPLPGEAVYWTVPAAIGYTFTSQGQILRPIAPQEAGAQNGPALAKTRRSHQFGALLHQTQGVSFGTTFDHLRPAQLSTKRGVAIPLTTLYSDIHWDALDDSYSFDSMLCWQYSRPYPGTICTIGAFLHTQDR